MPDSNYFWVTDLDDHLLVLDRGKAELHVLNPAASILFLLLEDGDKTFNELVEAYSTLVETNSNPSDIIRPTLSAWQNDQWVVEKNQHLSLRKELDGMPKPFGGRAKLLPHPANLSPAKQSEIFWMQLQSDTQCRIRFAVTEKTNAYPDAIPRLKAILSGLKSSPSELSVDLTFLIDGEDIYIQTPNYSLVTTDESFGLSSLATGILHHSYQERNPFATLHAAALIHKNCNLIMPGRSGSGKSTLAGYLAAHGWHYLGDDVVALGSGDKGAEVLPFCTAIGLKPGSWELLKPWYPQLDNLPVIPYADRKARFIEIEPPSRQQRAFKNVVVLPKYNAQCEGTHLQRLSKSDAMIAIIHSGLTVGVTPNANNLIHILNFIQSTECYAFKYANLDAADRALKELCDAIQ
ncbi:MAG: hypothetical protein AB7C96_12690 [Hydrogenovibrio sp.]